MSFPKHSADPSVSGPFAKIPSHESHISLMGPAGFDSTYRGAPGGFRAREGYPTATPAPDSTRKLYIPNTQWTWAFAIVTLVQTIVTLALEW